VPHCDLHGDCLADVVFHEHGLLEQHAPATATLHVSGSSSSTGSATATSTILDLLQQHVLRPATLTMTSTARRPLTSSATPSSSSTSSSSAYELCHELLHVLQLLEQHDASPRPARPVHATSTMTLVSSTQTSSSTRTSSASSTGSSSSMYDGHGDADVLAHLDLERVLDGHLLADEHLDAYGHGDLDDDDLRHPVALVPALLLAGRPHAGWLQLGVVLRRVQRRRVPRAGSYNGYPQFSGSTTNGFRYIYAANGVAPDMVLSGTTSGTSGRHRDLPARQQQRRRYAWTRTAARGRSRARRPPRRPRPPRLPTATASATSTASCYVDPAYEANFTAAKAVANADANAAATLYCNMRRLPELAGGARAARSWPPRPAAVARHRGRRLGPRRLAWYLADCVYDALADLNDGYFLPSASTSATVHGHGHVHELLEPLVLVDVHLHVHELLEPLVPA